MFKLTKDKNRRRWIFRRWSSIVLSAFLIVSSLPGNIPAVYAAEENAGSGHSDGLGIAEETGTEGSGVAEEDWAKDTPEDAQDEPVEETHGSNVEEDGSVSDVPEQEAQEEAAAGDASADASGAAEEYEESEGAVTEVSENDASENDGEETQESEDIGTPVHSDADPSKNEEIPSDKEEIQPENIEEKAEQETGNSPNTEYQIRMGDGVLEGDCGKEGDNAHFKLTFHGNPNSSVGTAELEITGSGELEDGALLRWILRDYESLVSNFDPAQPPESVEVTSLRISGISRIGNGNFSDAPLLREVTIDDVKTIGKQAFFNCPSLELVEFPQTLRTIEEEAFYNCSHLYRIRFMGGPVSIGSSAFEEDSLLTTADFNGLVRSVGERAFLGTGLGELYGDGIKTIGQEAFRGCQLQTISLPDVSSIGVFAFYDNGGAAISETGLAIEQVYLGGPQTVANGLFNDTILDLTLDGSVENIDSYAFSGLVEGYVTLGENVKTIGEGAFQNCYIARRRDLVLPEGVTQIGANAFDMDCSFNKVTIPLEVGKIGANAFSRIKAQTVVVNSLGTGDGNADSLFSGAVIENMTIGGNVETIDSDVLKGASINCLSIGNSVQEIKEGAFTGCSKLKQVVIGDGITTLGEETFKDRDDLEEIILPETLTSIQPRCFEGCKNLSRMVLFAQEAPSADMSAFDGVDTGLVIRVSAYNATGYDLEPWCNFTVMIEGQMICSEIPFGNDLTYEIDSQGTLTIKGDGSMPDFENEDSSPWKDHKNKIRKIVISSGITHVGSHAFSGCKYAKGLELPATLVSIGEMSFKGIQSLQEVDLPEGLETVGKEAFSGCGLEKLTIPSTILALGEHAFSYCEKLRTVDCSALTAPGADADLFTHSGCTPETSELYLEEKADRDSYDCAPWKSCFRIFYMGKLIESGKCGQSAEWRIYKSGTLVISGTGPMYNFGPEASDTWRPTANEVYGGYNTLWDYYRYFLKKVIVEEGITSIGSEVFIYFSNLARAEIASSVETIGANAFQNNFKLKEVVFAEGSRLKTIKNEAFYNCESLDLFDFPEGLESIGTEVFQGCGSNWSQTRQIELPASVKSIDGRSFFGLQNISAYHVAEDNPYFSSADGVLFNKNKTTLIAFAGHEGSSYTIPNTVTSIGDLAFYKCKAANITLPDGLTSIGERAFCRSNCNNICTASDWEWLLGENTDFTTTDPHALVIPSTVKSIGDFAFSSCDNIKLIYLRSAVAPANAGYSWIEYDKVIRVPSESGGYDEDFWWEYNILFGDQESIGASHFVFDHNKEKNEGSYTIYGINAGSSDNTYDLTADLYPSKAVNKTVDWKSSDENVVSILSQSYEENSREASCVLKIKKAGTAVITATAENGKSSSYILRVIYRSPQMDCDHLSYNSSVIPPTCTEPGRTGVIVCLVCGMVLDEGEELPAPGHDWNVNYTACKEATCTEAGSREKVCAVCGEKITEEIPAIGHKWNEEYTVDKEPTCTEAGSREKVCTICGDKITEEIPAIGHKWNEEYTVDKEPTSAEEGLKSIHCAVCDSVKEGSEVAIPAASKNIGTLVITGIENKTYTGTEITQEIEIRDGDYELVENTDYTVTYLNNKNTGTASANIQGIGNYSGTVTFTFMIKPGKTSRGDMFNLANNVKVTWKEVPRAKYYKVYREGVTDKKETRKDPVIVTTGLVGWDKDPGLTNGHAYRYRIVASLTGKDDPSGDSLLSYSKVMYRLKTVAIRSVKNTAPGKVTVKYDKTTSGDSYVLQYCERQDMVGAKTKVVLGANNTTYILGGLKKGKTYYISIRVRKKVNGIDYYTTFGVAKKVIITK